SEQERIDELRWFVEVSQPFRGQTIRSVAEDIETHYWERDVLAPAFEELTGIHVEHEIIGEGSVVERLVEQQRTGRRIYDIYVNDADLVGTHLRTGAVVNLTDYMAGEGTPFTNPYLDLDDFLNLEFGQDYEGNQLQLPDQHFANLYWFRYDWFTDPFIQAQFEEIHGYSLGVPVNWAAYEDIANFFTYEVRGISSDEPGYINGIKIYGHLDYGRTSPSLGWRFTDAWLSIAGVGDVGLPNGLPVDEWGIRVIDGIPVGASVTRGGEANGPAAVYALESYIRWLNRYAPPEARSWTWVDAGPQAARGDIAQSIFQYTTFLSDGGFHNPDSPVTDENGLPLWRVAPTPHGRYWDEGMKVGYQDAGSWTIPISVRGARRAMAWLWAQFSVSRTVAVDKFLAGATPVRESTVCSDVLSERILEYGGLIEFYRSSESKKWTDTGLNVPDYPRLSSIWWRNIAQAIEGKITAQQAMDNIASQMDEAMNEMQMAHFSPQLNDPQPPEFWVSLEGSPKAERPPEQPLTVPYDELIFRWEKECDR
ncbi:MAG TPA: ABC transporter substrate-binding protein, partial [Aggregatilineales bacterium]|nr:ABC transporter substrate-binding protein [Aggregatilineales bacterium]